MNYKIEIMSDYLIVFIDYEWNNNNNYSTYKIWIFNQKI